MSKALEYLKFIEYKDVKCPNCNQGPYEEDSYRGLVGGHNPNCALALAILELGENPQMKTKEIEKNESLTWEEARNRQGWKILVEVLQKSRNMRK